MVEKSPTRPYRIFQLGETEKTEDTEYIFKPKPKNLFLRPSLFSPSLRG